jgi:hypothetical protein
MKVVGNCGKYKPAFGRSTPSTAKVFPNATVKFALDAGSNPGGVNALVTPATATVKRILGSIINLSSKYQISKPAKLMMIEWKRMCDSMITRRNKLSQTSKWSDDDDETVSLSSMFRNIMRKRHVVQINSGSFICV